MDGRLSEAVALHLLLFKFELYVLYIIIHSLYLIIHSLYLIYYINKMSNLSIDDFISKKDFERYLFQIIHANILVFDDFNVVNILVGHNTPIFNIHKITINSDEMFVNIFSQSNKLDCIIKTVSDLYGTYKHKNCVLVVLGNNMDFIAFTYQFNEIQMNEFNNNIIHA